MSPVRPTRAVRPASLRIPLFVPARVVIAALLVPLLSGCNLIGTKPTTVVTYSPSVQIVTEAAWPNVDWQLSVGKPAAESMLSSARIAVRPGDGAELQVLGGARWSDTMPELLQALIVRAFEDSGRIVGVGRQASGLRADYTLTLDVRAFEAVYADGGAPTALIEFNAKLMGFPSNRVLATRTFEARARAAGRDAADVVAAFDSALEESIGALVGWTLEQGRGAAGQSSPH